MAAPRPPPASRPDDGAKNVAPPTTLAVRAPRELAGLCDVTRSGVDGWPLMVISVNARVRMVFPSNLPDCWSSTSFTKCVGAAWNYGLAAYQNGFVNAGAESLAEAGYVGIHAVDHADGNRGSGRNLHSRGLERRARGRILSGFALLSIATELQVPNVGYVKCVHAIAHCHANVAGVAAQVLPRDYFSTAKR